MNHHLNPQQRDISSSEDHCRCQACKNQQDLKNYQRQNVSNIYMYKHLKKRGVPPVKKDFLNKDSSHKAKYMTKKQELERKLQPEKIPATPTKHKLIQVLRSKQIPNSSFFIEYHQVSHSQREKLPSKDAGSNKLEQPRRVTNAEEIKGGSFYKDNKPRTGATKLIQISQNPQNIRLRHHISRSVSQASASCNGNISHYLDQPRQQSVKSLQKIKD